MTNQEIFNKIWQHFVVEKNPRSMRENLCVYRGFGGAKCAVGILIPDELYDPRFEKQSWGTLCRESTLPEFRKLQEFLGEINEGFLEDMQAIHDSSFLFETYESSMREQAERWALTIPGE